MQPRPDGPRGGATLKDLKNSGSVLRLLRLLLKTYKVSFGVVIVCIAVSAVTSLASSLFTRSLIDDYITPMLSVAIPDYGPLAAIILAGIIAGYVSSILMIRVGQGTMKRIREDLFRHMEDLPLKFFDSHSHGDLMSVYTNDVDTLRQVIGNTLPNLFSSVVTIIATLVSMLVLSIPLTLVSVVMAFLMYKVTTFFGKLSRKYFTERQKNLGIVNGFIEEMVSGQKVVKVYCHEEEAVEDFEVLNENLRKSVFHANRIGNIIMPVNTNLGNFTYVFLAILGAVIALGGWQGWFFRGLDGALLTLGTLVSFLTLQKNFSRPVSQISNEINSIVMATAGADRIFALLDAPLEKDEGKVKLVHIDGEGKEVSRRTGSWAWKSPDGRLTPLRGEVSLKDVDFSYVEGKQVLYDITLTAYPGQKIAFVGGEDDHHQPCQPFLRNPGRNYYV